MRGARVLSLLLLAARDAVADVYMQYPPGSNNRLAEGGGNRNNNNRLMDTQNNAKGGYGYGGNSNTDNTGMGSAEIVKYYAGSQLPVAWTAQHSCGREEAECQIVIQYMCNDRVNNPGPGGPYSQEPRSANNANEGPVRDGAHGNTPNPNAPDSDTGLHEPASFYNACANRERNKGLYTADQNLNSNRATRTRQNPNGARSGLECAEERDYYPYWAPTPWKVCAKGWLTPRQSASDVGVPRRILATLTRVTWSVICAPLSLAPCLLPSPSAWARHGALRVRPTRRPVYALSLPDTAPFVRARRARSRLDSHPSPTSATPPPSPTGPRDPDQQPRAVHLVPH